METMRFKKIDAADIAAITAMPGLSVHLDEETLARCASDETEDLAYLPELVAEASDAESVAALLAYCSPRKIPVTTRGAGTGLSGGALPVFGGVVLDTRKMNRVLHIDKENFQVTVEPGVITQVLQEQLKAQGLFYPPDPSSRGSCFIGGNVAENSGGPRAVKYGVVKDYVLNLQIALADGSLIWTGANVLKNATGYNLTQLITGSEGTLAVITKIVLRLIPAVREDLLMLVPFRSAEQACKAVNAILLAGHNPSALEFMERDALEWVMRFVDTQAVPLPEDIRAHLLIEVDGNDRDQLFLEMEKIAEVVSAFDIGEPMFADNAAQKDLLWQLRRKVGEAVKSNSIYKEEDTVVPRAKLPELLAFVKSLGRQYGFHSVCYGHAGDGNLHINIVRGELPDEVWNDRLPEAIRELFEAVVDMGGTISGEHGIGLVQARYLDTAFNAIQMGLMKSIKDLFDPQGILNPGKIFPAGARSYSNLRNAVLENIV